MLTSNPPFPPNTSRGSGIWCLDPDRRVDLSYASPHSPRPADGPAGPGPPDLVLGRRLWRRRRRQPDFSRMRERDRGDRRRMRRRQRRPRRRCDDGNVVPGDGCDADCNLESILVIDGEYDLSISLVRDTCGFGAAPTDAPAAGDRPPAETEGDSLQCPPLRRPLSRFCPGSPAALLFHCRWPRQAHRAPAMDQGRHHSGRGRAFLTAAFEE